ncbi:hypothetical protein SteCoe_1109 [Stentor coeruleus]|uniref:Uncharacterized protein n=1 Tax=Stentor coeruleus TaxID=5963 RepID=A0A1R2D2Q4_9CILI|nr:hypothetical protein SteCoe_1109 [Stentor coeruleus]
MTSFTIGKPASILVPSRPNYFAPTPLNIKSRLKTDFAPHDSAVNSSIKEPNDNSTKHLKIIKQLEETIKEKTQALTELEKDHKKLTFQLEKTLKLLVKEQEDFENYKEECMPNNVWKSRFLEHKLIADKKLQESTSAYQLLEKKHKDLETRNYNARKKIESLHKDIESKDKTIENCQKDKASLHEQLELSNLLVVRLFDLLKNMFGKAQIFTLNMQYMNLDDSFLPTIFRIIEMNPNIESVNLEGNYFSDEGMKNMSVWISSCNGNLNYMNLSYNKITIEGAWELLKGFQTRENLLNKITKKVVLSYNLLEEQDLFIKAFEAIKDIRENYSIIKIKKKDFKIARGPQLGRLFKILCDKMFDNKDIKQLTYLLDKFEVQQVSEEELLKLSIRNKKEVYAQFLSNPELISHQKSFKSRIFRLSTNKITLKDIEQPRELDINLLMAQRPGFVLSYIKKAIKAGLKIDTIDKKIDETLLMYAARTGNLNLCKLLVSKLANIHVKNSTGNNAFLIACNHDHFDISDYLIVNGGKLESADNKGANAIHHAIKEGKVQKIVRLTQMGISVNLSDNKKKTPLHYAAKSGDIAMADLLIRLGADANALDYKGRSPVALAEDYGKTYFVSTITSMGAKKLRMIVGKEEYKPVTETEKDKSLEGLLKNISETVDSTQKLYRDLKETNKMLDPVSLDFNSSFKCKQDTSFLSIPYC